MEVLSGMGNVWYFSRNRYHQLRNLRRIGRSISGFSNAPMDIFTTNGTYDDSNMRPEYGAQLLI